MLIGFQCFQESQEEVGARQKKRNWNRDVGFSSGPLNPSPWWPPEWNGDLTSVVGKHVSGCILQGYSQDRAIGRGEFVQCKSSTARGLCNIKDILTLYITCTNQCINTNQRVETDLFVSGCGNCWGSECFSLVHDWFDRLHRGSQMNLMQYVKSQSKLNIQQVSQFVSLNSSQKAVHSVIISQRLWSLR